MGDMADWNIENGMMDDVMDDVDRKSSTVIWFGKYAGKTIWEVGVEFAEWLVRQEAKTERFRKLQEEAKLALSCHYDALADSAETDLRWDE